jgi:hypothetical protein
MDFFRENENYYYLKKKKIIVQNHRKVFKKIDIVQKKPYYPL